MKHFFCKIYCKRVCRYTEKQCIITKIMCVFPWKKIALILLQNHCVSSRYFAFTCSTFVKTNIFVCWLVFGTSWHVSSRAVIVDNGIIYYIFYCSNASFKNSRSNVMSFGLLYLFCSRFKLYPPGLQKALILFQLS